MFSARTFGKKKAETATSRHPGLYAQQKLPCPKSPAEFSCLLSNPARGGRSQGIQARTCQPTGSFWALSLAVNWDHGALDHAEHWEKQARLALGMELSWRRLGLPLWLRRKSRVFTLTWPQRHYKWQHMAAPWGTASSGPSLHPPVHLCLLLMLRGKYLAKI